MVVAVRRHRVSVVLVVNKHSVVEKKREKKNRDSR